MAAGADRLGAVFTRLGLRDEGSRLLARAILEDAGAGDDPDGAAIAIGRVLARHCGDPRCAGAVADGRLRVVVDLAACEACGGSANARAGAWARSALVTEGVRRLVVVGGTTALHVVLREVLEGPGLELRIVEGAGGRVREREAQELCRWADLVAVWASTPLGHCVSELFTRPGRARRLVIAHKRGVAAFCEMLLDERLVRVAA